MEIYDGAYLIKSGVGPFFCSESPIYALTSRAIAVVGVAETIQEARELSLTGINAIEGGSLWHRTDIASNEHIKRSIDHMQELRLDNR